MKRVLHAVSLSLLRLRETDLDALPEDPEELAARRATGSRRGCG
jgi:hypothetical protein